MDVNVVALFCEDIREEVAGTQSLIGVLPDNLSFPQVPVIIPKLGFYIRLHAAEHVNLNDIRCVIREPDGTETNLPGFDKKVLKESREKALKAKAPYIGLVMRGAATPFHVTNYGRIELLVTIEGAEILAGSLNIVPPID